MGDRSQKRTAPLPFLIRLARLFLIGFAAGFVLSFFESFTGIPKADWAAYFALALGATILLEKR